MRTSIFKVESKYNIKYIVLSTNEDYQHHALRDSVQYLFNARGKNYTFSGFNYQHPWIKANKIIESNDSIKLSSVSDLMQWASSVVLIHEEPVYEKIRHHEYLFSLLVPKEFKTHISICSSLESGYYKNLLSDITTGIRMFKPNKDAIAEFILERLIALGLKSGGDVHHTICGEPIIYTTGFRLSVEKRTGLITSSKDEFRFYKNYDEEHIIAYKAVED